MIGVSLPGQRWGKKASVVFCCSCAFYRSKWRYDMQAHPTVLIDSGYITRNLTLAAGSISVGGCAVASVDGSLSDHGEEETFCYAMPVGTESPDNRDAEDALCAFVRQKGL